MKKSGVFHSGETSKQLATIVIINLRKMLISYTPQNNLDRPFSERSF